MEQDTHETMVVFRKYPDGSILALFPCVLEGNGMCSSYQHIGQHGGADYTGCIQATVPAMPEDYTPLLRELVDLGYKLRIVQRRPS